MLLCLSWAFCVVKALVASSRPSHLERLALEGFRASLDLSIEPATGFFEAALGIATCALYLQFKAVSFSSVTGPLR